MKFKIKFNKLIILVKNACVKEQNKLNTMIGYGAPFSFFKKKGRLIIGIIWVSDHKEKSQICFNFGNAFYEKIAGWYLAKYFPCIVANNPRNPCSWQTISNLSTSLESQRYEKDSKRTTYCYIPFKFYKLTICIRWTYR